LRLDENDSVLRIPTSRPPVAAQANRLSRSGKADGDHHGYGRLILGEILQLIGRGPV